MGVFCSGPEFRLYSILVRSEMDVYMSVMYRSIMQWIGQGREKTQSFKSKEAIFIDIK
jgi:hypothetical protein